MSTDFKPKVRVVTDSTADMTPETLQKFNIEVVPLLVLIGDKSYRDGVDISASEFYKILPKQQKLPTTSQPSPGNFMETYEKATADGASVISLHLSSRLSGTFANATVAARNFPEGRVRVFDTKMISAAQAMFVLAAAEMAQSGSDIDEIEIKMKAMLDNVRLIATLDTLEYLHKGGRIGGLKNFFGSLLSVKPLLQLKDGEVQPLEQVRTRGKAVQRVAELTKNVGKLERLAVMHAADPEGAEQLAGMLEAVFPRDKMFISDIGPVIGAHVGPRTLGVGYQKAAF